MHCRKHIHLLVARHYNIVASAKDFDTMKGAGKGIRKRQRTSTLTDFFPQKSKKLGFQSSTTSSIISETIANNPEAEKLGQRLSQSPSYLTSDGKSWYILAKAWMLPTSKHAFDREWALHPKDRHRLQVYGRSVLEKRWSQSWGVSYSYSGATNPARPVAESTVLPRLLDLTNDLVLDKEDDRSKKPYNGCLQNWYTPEDSIGLHADDEKSISKDYPIFSLSWGGPRRFLFRKKQPKTAKGTNNSNDNSAAITRIRSIPADEEKYVVELWLEDGDLLVMGGTCQETHKHEVPTLRKKDPPSSNRINYTIRAFR